MLVRNFISISQILFLLFLFEGPYFSGVQKHDLFIVLFQTHLQDLLLWHLLLYIFDRSVFMYISVLTSFLPWQVLNDIQLQLSYMEKVERSTCSAQAHCVSALREAHCVLLEGELDVIQDMISLLQQPTGTKLMSTSSFLTAGKVCGEVMSALHNSWHH